LKRRTLLLVLLALLLVVAMLWPRERLLLKLAHQVAELPGWSGAQQWYMWRSDQEVLLYSNENFTGGERSLVSLDMRTGKEILLSGWVKRLAERQDKYNAFWVSPDGAWLLYSDYYEGTVSATDAQGQHCVRWSSPLWDSAYISGRDTTHGKYLGWDSIQWLPDSRRWVQPEFDKAGNHVTCLVVRDVRAPQIVRKIPIPSSGQTHLSSLFEEEYQRAFLSETHFVQFTSHRGLALSQGDAVDIRIDQLIMDEADLSAPESARTWTIPVSEEWDVQEIRLSPQGEYLAWVVCGRKESALERLFLRLHVPLPMRTTAASSSRITLYISDIEGRDVEEIGSVQAKEKFDLGGIQWLPGGEQISFVFEDILYVVPVSKRLRRSWRAGGE
jgi:hypothetical protein